MRLDTRVWALITVVVVGAILAGGWFLGVSPQIEAMNAANDQRKEVVAQNDAIQAKLVALQNQKGNLSELQDEAVGLEKTIPSDAGAAEFITTVNNLALATGVTVQSISFSGVQSYAPPASPSPDPTSSPASTPAPTNTPSPESTAPPTGAPPVLTDARITADNFVLLPVDISVAGDWNGVLAFVKGLQSGERLVLVSKLTTTVADDGSFTTKISGTMYVLLRDDRLQIAKHLAEEAASAAATPAPEDSAEPEDAEAGSEPPAPEETPAG